MQRQVEKLSIWTFDKKLLEDNVFIGPVGEPETKRRKSMQVYTDETAVLLFGQDDVAPVVETSWQAELKKYRQQRKDEPKSTNILWWWCQNEVTFPHLANLAKQVLHIQVTSAASERFWSFLHLLERDDRTALSDTHIHMILFLKANLLGVLKNECIIQDEETDDDIRGILGDHYEADMVLYHNVQM